MDTKEKEIEDFDAKTERYLKGEMTDGEEKEYTQLLNTDNELKQRAKAMAYLVKNIRAEQNARIIADTIKAAKASAHDSFKAWRAKLTAVAAIGLIIIGLGYTIHNVKANASHELASQYWSSYSSGTTRGNEETAEEDARLEKAIQETLSGKVEAIETLKKCYEESADPNNTASYYRATYAWHLALAYLDQNRRDEAKEILRTITQEQKGKAMGDDAEKLTKQIDELW